MYLILTYNYFVGVVIQGMNHVPMVDKSQNI